MDAAFHEAANPRRFKVLGLQLQPLTLGHRFLLVQHGSAFVSGGQAKIEDLMLSTFICCQPWRQAERNLSVWWFRLFMVIWWKFISWTVFKKKEDPARIQIEYQKFHSYIAVAEKRPVTSCKKNHGTVNAPLEWWLLVTLMTELGMSMDQALDTPTAKANCMLASLGDARGGLELMDERRLTFLAQVERAEALKFGAN